MLPAMVEVIHFYGTVNFVTVGTWDGTGYRTMSYQKKITKNTVLSTYPVPVEIYGITYMKKVTEFREILQNFAELCHTKFSGIPQNFSQFRAEYGIDGSKKKQMELCVDGIPWTPYPGDTPPPPHTDGFKADQISPNPPPPSHRTCYLCYL
jgi:hypothetical protein